MTDSKEDELESFASTPIPLTWVEHFHPNTISRKAADADTEDILATITGQSTTGMPLTIAENSELTILSIASGTKGKTIVLHSFDAVLNNDGDEELVALMGFGRIANVFTVDTHRAFAKSHNIAVPEPTFIIKKVTAENTESLPFTDGKAVAMSVIMSTVIPAWLTADIHQFKLSSATDILAHAVAKVKQDVLAQSPADVEEEYVINTSLTASSYSCFSPGQTCPR